MSFSVKGQIEMISDTSSVSASFKKREFVLVVQEGQYPEYIKMQLTQERCSLVDGYSPGDEVTVHFNLRGRPYTKNGETIYFTNLDAWKIEGAAAPVKPQQPQHSGEAPPPPPPPAFDSASEDELPF